jgi:hypothetical protein
MHVAWRMMHKDRFLFLLALLWPLGSETQSVAGCWLAVLLGRRASMLLASKETREASVFLYIDYIYTPKFIHVNLCIIPLLGCCMVK